MNNKVFVFGASGFLGAALLKNLPSRWELVGVGRNDEDLFFDLEFSDPNDLSCDVSMGDYWVFLAAITSPDVCESNPDFAFSLNVDKTQKLLDWLTGHGVRVIFASSDTVFGGKCGIAYDGDSLQPMGEYANHKALIENFVYRNPLVKIMRLSYIFGNGDKFSKLVSRYEKSREKLDVFIGFERQVVLLDDVVLGVKNLIFKWDEFSFQNVNFCGPDLVDRCEIASLLKDKFFHEVHYNFVEAPESFWVGRVKSIHLDYSNFTKVLSRPPKSINQLKVR